MQNKHNAYAAKFSINRGRDRGQKVHKLSQFHKKSRDKYSPQQRLGIKITP